MNNKKVVYSILGLFTVVFLGLAGYMIYFTMVESKEISIHPYNRRLDHLEGEVIRGNIYDTNGNLLATTEDGQRVYPYGARYAHAVGYSQIGKYGAEAQTNVELLYPDYNLKSIFENTFMGKKFEGRDVVLTLDDRLQKISEEAMQGYKGSVVILEPSTGKIKAMYSTPGFNPNQLVANWDSLSSDQENSPLVNRATQGLYPPGSIFKILPTIALIESGLEYENIIYECTGSITQGDYTIKCFNGNVHGKINLKQAFEKSCNTYFIHLQEYIKPKELQALGESLLFNKSLPLDIEYNKSRLEVGEKSTPFDVAAAYIGQGRTLVTPMHMAMLASMLANDGVLMEPYLFDFSKNEKGRVLLKNLPNYHRALINENTAQILQEYMMGVIRNGTASRLSTRGLRAGGKTGTAQNETGKDHSWFIGFAQNVEKPESEIAFAVIVENGGQGAKSLDVTQQILRTFVYLE